MQKRLAAPSRAKARVRARGLRSDGYWEEVEVGKRWRLVLKAEIADLIKSRNFYLIFAILIALSVNFFILILLQLLLNLNSESDSSFRAIYKNNLLIYNRTALFSLSYFFLI